MDIISMLNGKHLPVPSVASILDEAMQARGRCLDDENNMVKAVTVTLRPSLHGIPPDIIRQMIRSLTKNIVCKYRTKIYVEIHYEFTKAMVLHMHLLIVGRRTSIGRIIANYRNSFGFCLVKDVTKLDGWLEYMNKENVYTANRYFN